MLINVGPRSGFSPLFLVTSISLSLQTNPQFSNKLTLLSTLYGCTALPIPAQPHSTQVAKNKLPAHTYKRTKHITHLFLINKSSQIPAPKKA